MSEAPDVTILEKDGEPAFAVLRYRDYRRLLAALEDRADAVAAGEAEARIAAGEEVLPFDVTKRLLAGDSPLRVWREHRGLTQSALATGAALSQNYVSALESGKRKGTPGALRRLADALGVDIDDIV